MKRLDRIRRGAGRALRHQRRDSRAHRAVRARLESNPLDAGAHRELAVLYRDEGTHAARLRAHAESRTAAALAAIEGADGRGSEGEPFEKTASISSVEDMDHNRNYRFRTLAAAVRRLGKPRPRVLDVGGGDGGLAFFLPEADYVLAEPSVNGIDGAALPFAPATFDVVCACHVFEHIPPEQRTGFLDNLVTASRGDVILLNPFALPDSLYPRRLELMLELTGASWAREHLECGLPSLDEVTRYAEARALESRVEANGCLTTSLAMAFVGHYARLAGRQRELERIHALFNELGVERATNPVLPVAFLIHLSRR